MKHVRGLPERRDSTALAFLSGELRRLSMSVVPRDTGDASAPEAEPRVRPEIEQALDTTWQHSEAVYRSLADDER